MKFLLVALLLTLSPGVLAQTVTNEPVKKPAAKKVVPKKTPPAKKETAQKAVAPPKVTVYKNDPKAPIIRDKQGNVVPTNPEAYDVSSAVGKK